MPNSGPEISEMSSASLNITFTHKTNEIIMFLKNVENTSFNLYGNPLAKLKLLSKKMYFGMKTWEWVMLTVSAEKTHHLGK